MNLGLNKTEGTKLHVLDFPDENSQVSAPSPKQKVQFPYLILYVFALRPPKHPRVYVSNTKLCLPHL